MLPHGISEETAKELLKRFTRSQEVDFNLKHVIDQDTFNLVSAHAQELDCARELIFFPLLTAVASCMSASNTRVQVSSGWSESVVLWCLVAARRGEKKTSALNRMKHAVRGIEQEFQELYEAQNPNISHNAGTPAPLFLVDESSIREADDMLVKRTDPILAMVDNLGSVLRWLNSVPYSCQPPSLLRSYEGTASDRSKSSKLTPVCPISFVAMIQAVDIVSLFDESDPDGLLDRILVVCPPEMSYAQGTRFRSQNAPDLKPLLARVRNVHRVQQITYTFNQDARSEFNRCTTQLKMIKASVGDCERFRGIVNKASGHLARLCAVMTALSNAVAMATRGGMSHVQSSRVINCNTVRRSYHIVKYVLQQKFSLFASDGVQFVLNHRLDPALEQTTLEEEHVNVNIDDMKSSENSADIYVDISGQDDEVVEVQENHTHNQGSMKRTNNNIDKHGNQAAAVHEFTEDMAMDTFPSSSNEFQCEAEAAQTQLQKELTASALNLIPTSLATDGSMEQSAVYYDGSRSNEYDNEADAAQTQLQKELTASALNLMPTHLAADDSMEQSTISYDGFVDSRASRYGYQPQRKQRPRPQQMFMNRSSSGPTMTRIVACSTVGPLRSAKDKLDVNDLSDEEFINQCGEKIKKLLLTQGSAITAAYACQYRLFPSVPRHQRRTSMKTTHPAWAAGKFFERLEKFGLGLLFCPRGGSIRFKKRRLEEMTPEALELMKRINLPEEWYERTYPKCMGLPNMPVAFPEFTNVVNYTTQTGALNTTS